MPHRNGGRPGESAEIYIDYNYKRTSLVAYQALISVMGSLHTHTHTYTQFSHTSFFLFNEGPFSTYTSSKEAAERKRELKERSSNYSRACTGEQRAHRGGERIEGNEVESVWTEGSPFLSPFFLPNQSSCCFSVHPSLSVPSSALLIYFEWQCVGSEGQQVGEVFHLIVTHTKAQ